MNFTLLLSWTEPMFYKAPKYVNLLKVTFTAVQASFVNKIQSFQ